MNPKAYRLPRSVLPRHYAIDIDARIGDETLRGRVAIEVDIATPCTAIELHARDLRISEAGLNVAGQVLQGTVTLDADRDLVTLRLPQTVPAGPATLQLVYEGPISTNGLQGMYLGTNGTERML